MKVRLVILAAAFLSLLCSPAAFAQDDSSAFSALGAKLEEYLTAIERDAPKIKCNEADFLIESCQDSLTRQFAALKIYSHYMNSPLMGDEAVAVHVCDNWFISGKVKMKSEEDLIEATMFAEFNRQSLIGCRAPEISVQDTAGAYIDLFGSVPDDGRFTVLYFYDTDCATCEADGIVLKSMFGKENYPVHFYAVYTGADYEKWTEYISTGLNFGSPAVDMRHFWDPDMSSGYQMKYGVLKTPSIFVIDGRGVIVGRRLDPVSLAQLLKICLSPAADRACEFGSRESSEFYDKLLKPDFSCADADSLRKCISSMTLAGGDTLMFRQMTGDMLHWLAGKSGAEAKCALGNLLVQDVFGKRELWAKSADSLSILPFAEILDDLLSRAEPGTKMPEISVEGTMKRGKKSVEGIYNLSRLRNATVIFHTGGCENCKAELAAADSLCLKDRKARVLLVNMDDLLAYRPETAKALFDAFDLTVLPYITATDNKGVIVGKYMTLVY